MLEVVQSIISAKLFQFTDYDDYDVLYHHLGRSSPRHLFLKYHALVPPAGAKVQTSSVLENDLGRRCRYRYNMNKLFSGLKFSMCGSMKGRRLTTSQSPLKVRSLEALSCGPVVLMSLLPDSPGFRTTPLQLPAVMMGLGSLGGCQWANLMDFERANRKQALYFVELDIQLDSCSTHGRTAQLSCTGGRGGRVAEGSATAVLLRHSRDQRHFCRDQPDSCPDRDGFGPARGRILILCVGQTDRR